MLSSVSTRETSTKDVQGEERNVEALLRYVGVSGCSVRCLTLSLCLPFCSYLLWISCPLGSPTHPPLTLLLSSTPSPSRRRWRCCPRRGWWGRQVSHVSPEPGADGLNSSEHSLCYEHIALILKTLSVLLPCPSLLCQGDLRLVEPKQTPKAPLSSKDPWSGSIKRLPSWKS